MLSLEEVAERLGVNERVVRENRRRWGLRSHKIGKFVRVRERDLENWVDRQAESA